MSSLHFNRPAKENAKFMPVLRERVWAWQAIHPVRLGGRLSVVGRAGFWFIAALTCYVWLLFGVYPWWAVVLAVALLGWCGLLLGFAIGHDASHGAVTKVPVIDKIIHLLSFVSIGIDPTLWRIRHIQAHHVFPNVTGGDTDASENPLLRLSPHQKWRPHFRWQALYAPLVYVVVIPYAIVIADWVRLNAEWSRRKKSGWHSQCRLLGAFLIYKVLHFGVFIGLPLMVNRFDILEVVTGYAVLVVSASLLFSAMLVGTHFCEVTVFPCPDSEGRLPSDWAVHNLITSCDWNPGSRLAAFISGGANTHTAHHLFPKLPNSCYRKITPIIRDTAREFGLQYNELSLFEMLRSHFSLLKRLGEKPLTQPESKRFDTVSSL